MLNIIGFNLDRTKKGIDVTNGGVCLFSDGKPEFAIAEERVTREKNDGGYIKALEYILKRTGRTIDSIDKFSVVNYGDKPIRSYEELLKIDNKLGVLDQEDIVFVPSHHLSHAYSTFWPSPYEEALILVMDNEGTILGERKFDEHWRNRMERVSSYVGRGENVTLLDRDLDGYDIPSLGEVYRMFTQFLGFESYNNAGKTMGLASYGSTEQFDEVDLFSLSDGEMRVHIDNYYANPIDGIRPAIEGVQSFAEENNIDFGEPRHPDEPITDQHKNAAAFVQSELEKVVTRKVKHLVEKTGNEKLCLAGGVAYNCVLNQRILEETPIEEVFIQPAAGDQGLGIGNCYYTYQKFGGERKIDEKYTTYLGGNYNSDEIQNTIHRFGVKARRIATMKELTERAAHSVAHGDIIAWYQGRSESGPRALGNRSIIANPTEKEIKDRVNEKIKHRESFRPFAPSVLADYADDYFDMPQEELPYMIVTVDVKEEAKGTIPGVVHVDGTSRIQTVTVDQNQRYHALLEAFYKKTNVPVLLNTSFNLSGMPIVETPFDALLAFKSSGIDKLFIGNYIVEKESGRFL